jgi:methionyl aminopeptidase
LGRISEAPIVEIYGFIESRPVRHPQARELMKEIGQKYKTLPFARRWLKGERVDFALAQLLKNGIIHKYPVLWEIEGALVSQAEHTVIVSENGCEVITAP